jgi:hypothetical protein
MYTAANCRRIVSLVAFLDIRRHARRIWRLWLFVFEEQYAVKVGVAKKAWRSGYFDGRRDEMGGLPLKQQLRIGGKRVSFLASLTQSWL